MRLLCMPSIPHCSSVMFYNTTRIKKIHLNVILEFQERNVTLTYRCSLLIKYKTTKANVSQNIYITLSFIIFKSRENLNCYVQCGISTITRAQQQPASPLSRPHTTQPQTQLQHPLSSFSPQHPHVLSLPSTLSTPWYDVPLPSV